jgi:hypothetical protein
LLAEATVTARDKVTSMLEAKGACVAFLLGDQRVTTGAGKAVKGTALVAVPLGETKRITPVVTPSGTTTLTSVAETTVKEAAATLPKLTLVAPVK